jgi:Macrocin-O-methyltransferase (TylF)
LSHKSTDQEAAVAPKQTIAEAMQNPRRGSIVDWPYSPVPQPGELTYQNPAVFLQNGETLRNSDGDDKSPYLTELLNKHRNEFFQIAMGYLYSSCVTGDYMEFGCYSATTFRMALTHACMMNLDARDKDMRFFAFDSFEGLPSLPANIAAESNWAEGSMAMSEDDFWQTIHDHDVLTERVESIPGFFDQSLNRELQQKFLAANQKISLVNIDCDLYESAVDVFNFIAPLLQVGSLIYLDDWYCGVKGSYTSGVPKAFFEFCEKHKIEVDRFRDCGWWGRSYTVLAV